MQKKLYAGFILSFSFFIFYGAVVHSDNRVHIYYNLILQLCGAVHILKNKQKNNRLIDFPITSPYILCVNLYFCIKKLVTYREE